MGLEKALEPNSRGAAINGGLVKCPCSAYFWYTKSDSIIFSCAIITGMTVSYVVTASKGNFFLDAHLAMQVLVPGWALPSWLKINKREGCNRNVIFIHFSKKYSRVRGVYSGPKSIPLSVMFMSSWFTAFKTNGSQSSTSFAILNSI